MAEKDLQLFFKKVDELTKMVDSLDKFPARRELLVKCKDHDQVVKLAKSWGYEIGRRWGDPLPKEDN